MGLTTKYQTYIFQFFSFLVGLSLILFNRSSSFEWPVGTASAEIRYTAILLPDGADFLRHCRLQWQDDCDNIVRSMAQDPDSLTADQRTDLENRLKKYLRRRNIMDFKIESRSLGAGGP